MKAIIALAFTVTLAGCVEEGDDLTNRHNTVTVCLGGVEYWILSPDSQLQALAPKINPKTLDFVVCK
jgi:hypothetical protein